MRDVDRFGSIDTLPFLPLKLCRYTVETEAIALSEKLSAVELEKHTPQASVIQRNTHAQLV